MEQLRINCSIIFLIVGHANAADMRLRVALTPNGHHRGKNGILLLTVSVLLFHQELGISFRSGIEFLQLRNPRNSGPENSSELWLLHPRQSISNLVLLPWLVPNFILKPDQFSEPLLLFRHLDYLRQWRLIAYAALVSC